MPGVSSDEWLSVLGRSQLKILLYIARHTSGRAREGGERASRVRAASSLSRRAITVKQGDESPGWVREAVALESLQVAPGEEEPLEPARMCVMPDLLRGDSARLADALVISPAPEARHRAARLLRYYDGPAGECLARELRSRYGGLEPLELDRGEETTRGAAERAGLWAGERKAERHHAEMSAEGQGQRSMSSAEASDGRGVQGTFGPVGDVRLS